MGPAIKRIRIFTWVCGTHSLLRYEVDHCIFAQPWLSCSVNVFLLALCHLTYVSIPTAKDAVVGLSAKNCLECIYKNLLHVGISSVPACLQVINQVLSLTTTCVRLALSGACFRTPTPSIWAHNAPLHCVVILLMTIFPLPDLLLNLLMKVVPAVSRFHHTRHTQPVRHRYHRFFPHTPLTRSGLWHYLKCWTTWMHRTTLFTPF